MEELLAEVLKTFKSNRAAPEQIEFPFFRSAKDDTQVWLEQVEEIKKEFELSDLQIVVRIGNYLLDDAKLWYDNWSPLKREWHSFKNDFSEAFPKKKILGKLLIEAALFNSSSCNTYVSYVHKKLSLLKSVRANWCTNDLIELIVHGLTEDKIKDSLIMKDFESISDLIAYLSTVTKPVVSKNVYDTHPTPVKRPRIESRSMSDTRVCFGCGQPGHMWRNCRRSNNNKRPNLLPTNTNKPIAHTSTRNTENKVLVQSETECQFCFKKGHVTDQCFLKQGIERRKNINVITANKNTIPTAVRIDSVVYMGLIDTGADVSLISDKFASVFEHKLEKHSSVLCGITPGRITSEYKFTADVDITGQQARLSFMLVPAEYLDYDVIIGCDLFTNNQLAAVTDYTGTKIIRRQLPGVLRIYECDTIRQYHVPDEYCSQITTLLEQYSDIIATGTKLPAVNGVTLDINLVDNFIVNRRPYRLAASEKDEVQKIVRELLENGIVRESSSPYSSPVLLVKKKDGNFRMVVDFRELNAHTVKDRYPLPRIDDQLDRLGKGKYFTSLDMFSGFHQILISPEHIHKTGFVTPDGHYEYVRMPFGLANAPAVFQRAITKALGTLRDNIALVYLDDVLIPSKTVEEGLHNLELVLEALRVAGFSLNLAKCFFLQSKLEYLGQEISAEGIRPGKRKVEALCKTESPQNIKQVRQFMGLASYFRKYIPQFATKMACITALTKNNVPFVWTDEHEQAKQYIISCLTSEPLLVVFNPDLPTELHTDASSLGYAGILMQRHDGQNKVVAYYSKRTTPTEARYHSYDLETLAIVNSLKHFRVYLIGIHFKIVTDCNSVKATAQKKEIIPRIARWWTYMQDFDYEIVYRKGSSLGHVDFLSRNPVSIFRITKHESWLHIEQKSNAEVQQMLTDLREGQLDANQYVEKNGLLCHQTVLPDKTKIIRYFVPRHSRLGLLRLFHDEQCHVGTDKTIDSITKHFWFPRIRSFVKNYVKHCLVCAVKKTRTGPLQGFIKLPEKPSQPLHTIHVDCLGPLPIINEYKYVFVIVDSYSKYCNLIPIKTLKSDETEQVLQNFISLFGTPKLVVMDAGLNFRNSKVCEFLDNWQVQYHFITPDVHRANGQVERYMRTLMNLIRIETRIKTEWPSTLWKIQLVLNTTMQKSTKMSPLQILIGIETSTPLIQSALTDLSKDLTPVRNLTLDRKRLAERLRPKQTQEDKINSSRSDSIQYSCGDFVLLYRASKMHASKTKFEYMGPYEVLGITAEGRYELKRVGKNKIVKAAKEQLRPWLIDWCLSVDMNDLLDLIENEGTEEEGKLKFLKY